MPKVNVIIPVYNAKKTIRKCVQSIRNQSLRDIRIIIVDDGSSDGSSKICDDLSKKDDRIIVIHKENGGVVKARNIGIENIEGDGYTTFCDADDYMPYNALENLYSLAKKTNADITCGTLKRFLKNKIFIKTEIPLSLRKNAVYERDDIIKKIIPSFYGITDFPGYMHTKLYRNSFLKKSKEFVYPVEFFQEDIAFNMQMCMLIDKLAVMPDVVSFYRMGGGTSKFMPKFWDDCIALYEFKVQQIMKYKLPDELLYTTSVELKNELCTWLQMYYQKYKNIKTKAEIKNEIEKCCNMPQVVTAVNYPKQDFSGVEGFRIWVKDKNVDSIFEFLHMDNKKTRYKRWLKKIVL